MFLQPPNRQSLLLGNACETLKVLHFADFKQRPARKLREALISGFEFCEKSRPLHYRSRALHDAPAVECGALRDGHLGVAIGDEFEGGEGRGVVAMRVEGEGTSRPRLHQRGPHVGSPVDVSLVMFRQSKPSLQRVVVFGQRSAHCARLHGLLEGLVPGEEALSPSPHQGAHAATTLVRVRRALLAQRLKRRPTLRHRPRVSVHGGADRPHEDQVLFEGLAIVSGHREALLDAGAEAAQP